MNILKNQWQELTGKLDAELVEAASYGVAVRYNGGHTAIKTHTKTLLSEFDLSPIITHFQLLY